jgi:all-trans-retinol 13,14-reductase
MKIGISYKQNPVKENYDAIIIGSGMGGLATAAILAKEGKKVLVLEKHYTAGGFTHSFTRNDYEWDIGIHYIGSVDNDKRSMKRMFDYITDGNLKLADMGEVYDRAFFGDTEYRFVKGVENWKRQMKEYFPSPEDGEAIDKYVALVKKANSSSKLFFAEKVLGKIPRMVVGSWLRSGYTINN